MQVTLIAQTQIVDWPLSIYGTEFINYDDTTYANDADRLAHFAGRSCYQSWTMPNPDTATDMGYMANILKQGHHSVLEHATATFYIEGVSRNLTHELIRHRHLSYSELSQRFVDMKDAKFIVPPAIRANHGPEDIKGFYDGIRGTDWEFDYTVAVDNLTAQGYSRKQAREAARFYLPSGMETKIVVSGNHRAWRDMLFKRYSVHADAEIRELATELLRQLRLVAPATYQDFPEAPFE